MKIYILIIVIFSILLQNEAFKIGISQNNEIQSKLISEENSQPRMTFIGEINGKSFYYETTAVNEDGAKVACSNAGMVLAYFDNMDEFDHISTNGPINRYWTDARHPHYLRYFTWEHNGGVIPGQKFSYFPSTDLGLTFYSTPNISDRKLTQTFTSQNYYPLCIAYAKKGNILKHPRFSSKASSPKEYPKIINEKIIPKRPAFESGPLPISVKLANPKMEFIGEFNGRSFYYDSQLVGRDDSKTICENLGMKMAYLESLAEIDFVYENVPADYFWVSGFKSLYESKLGNFQWENTDSVIPTSIQFTVFTDTDLGLVFSGRVGEFAAHFIQAKLEFSNAMPLCFLETKS